MTWTETRQRRKRVTYSTHSPWRRPMQQYQFSLRRLFWVSVICSAMIVSNLPPSSTVGELHVYTEGIGRRETLHIERGFPLHYQQSEEWLAPGSATDGLIADRERKIRLTHPHWLIVNMLVVFALAFGIPKAVLKLSRRVNTAKAANSKIA